MANVKPLPLFLVLAEESGNPSIVFRRGLGNHYIADNGNWHVDVTPARDGKLYVCMDVLANPNLLRLHGKEMLYATREDYLVVMGHYATDVYSEETVLVEEALSKLTDEQLRALLSAHDNKELLYLPWYLKDKPKNELPL